MVYLRPSIAIIDDDPALAEVLAMALGDDGYDTVIWPLGSEPLAFVRETRPDAVIADLRLSRYGHEGRCGLELIDALRSDAELQALPVILCSADSTTMQESEPRLKALGVIPVQKPFDLETLLDVVKRALTGAGEPLSVHSDGKISPCAASTPPELCRGNC